MKAPWKLCRQITRQSGSNFALAIRFLPKEKRRATEILYAFMRFTDDLADGLAANLTDGSTDTATNNVTSDLTNVFANNFVEQEKSENDSFDQTEKKRRLKRWQTMILAELPSVFDDSVDFLGQEIGNVAKTAGNAADDNADEEEKKTPSAAAHLSGEASFSETNTFEKNDPAFKTRFEIEPVFENEVVSETSHGIESIFEQGWGILRAFRPVMLQYHVPRKFLLDVVDGVWSDLGPQQTFETVNDSLGYCDRVASSVGFALLSLWGATGTLEKSAFKQAALACGRAFQWTNFLRDLREDFLRNRVYFPRDDFQKTGLELDTLTRWVVSTQHLSKKKRRGVEKQKNRRVEEKLKNFPAAFQTFFQCQFDRTERFYRESLALIPEISPECRRVFLMMWYRYYFLFRKIQQSPELIFQKRMTLTFWEKGKVLLNSFRGKIFDDWLLDKKG